MNYPRQLIMTIKYDHINQSIQAHFNIGLAETLPQERQAMDMINQHFNELVTYYIHQAVDHRLLKALGNSVRQMLKQVENQTGVEVRLEDEGLRI